MKTEKSHIKKQTRLNVPSRIGALTRFSDFCHAPPLGTKSTVRVCKRVLSRGILCRFLFRSRETDGTFPRDEN